MSFTDQYKKEDFLAVLNSNPKATTVIAKKVGCSRNTAKKFLAELEAEGKIKEIEIEGGFYAWVIAEQNVITFEGTIPKDGCIHTEYAENRYKLTIYKD